jgi:hypothetical protein
LTPEQQQQIAGFVREMRAAERANAERLRHEVDGVLTPAQRAQMHNELARRPVGQPAPQ